jgi:hypothetical protein
MVDVQFKIRNMEDEVIKAMLYVSPTVIPNSSSNSIIVGNSYKVGIGGANIDPVISLYPSIYDIRIAGCNFNTQFSIDISNAPTGSTVQASSYII